MKNVIGREVVIAQCPEMLSDESRYSLGVPDEVFFPENINDVKDLLTRAYKENLIVTFSGGRTGITGGAVPPDGGIIISFSNMKRILRCEKESDKTAILYCESGITLESIGRFLENPANWPEPVDGSELLYAGEFFYAADPTEKTAQLGGTVVTNASGARSFHYGATRKHIESIEVVLSTGELVKIKRSSKVESIWEIPLEKRTIKVDLPTYTWPCIKNASGFYNAPQLDPIDLFIGSEGTLGAICIVGIRLIKKPQFLSGLTFFPNRKAAFDFADFLRINSQIAAIEYFDESVFELFFTSKIQPSIDLPSLPENKQCAVYWEYIIKDTNSFDLEMDEWEEVLLRCGSSFDDTWSGFDSSESEKLKKFRHAVPEFVNSIVADNKRHCPLVRKIGTDSSIPGQYFREWFMSCVDKLIEQKIPFAAFGHLGDYHLHINMLPSNENQLAVALDLYHRFMLSACENGGTISAEHGVGKLKKDFLNCMFSEVALDQMRKIKHSFDPKWLLNKGTLF